MDINQEMRRSKVIDIEEAASWVKEGMTLGLGGGPHSNGPSAFVRELIRKKVKDLTLIPSNATGYQTDILLGARCVKKIYAAYVGLDYIGLAPNFKRLAQAGELNVVDLCELGLLYALKAGQTGAAFYALPDGILACDNVKLNPDWYKVVADPFTGKKVVVVPPLRADIAVVHTPKCDMYGNAREDGCVDPFVVSAADKVIITTEEVVPVEDTQAHYKEVTIFGNIVDGVVEIPYGAHPAECQGAGYRHDEEHLRAYEKAGRLESTFKEYLEKYVHSCKNHAAYLENIGMERLIKLRTCRYY
jgi:glutaconate CoA-transferase subunit A